MKTPFHRFLGISLAIGLWIVAKALPLIAGQETKLSETAPVAAAGRVTFIDVGPTAGLVHPTSSGDPNQAWTILESTGSGLCFLDVDADQDLDLFIVDGGDAQALHGGRNRAQDRLYLNDGQGHFVDATAAAGIVENAWGGGCAVADIEGDGDFDIFVSNYGADALWRNDGQGRFTETAAASGLADDRYSLGAAFFDFDQDGDLDLYVANYLEFDPKTPGIFEKRCRWKGGEVMCGPRGFKGAADTLYLNRGNGVFVPAPTELGLGLDQLYGMGVIAGDLDDDGDTDLFVANDSQENLLWRNDGGQFSEVALEAGVALAGDGRAQAGMGVDLGDSDGDGDDDLFVTNFSDDYHTLYRNDGNLTFVDVSQRVGLDPATRPSVGWGGGFFDFDNDGDLDIFVASGHVYHGVEAFDPTTSYLQKNLLFENDGAGRYREIGALSGPGFALDRSARGAAFADFDNDGDLDIAVNNQNEPPTLLRNDGGNARHWLKVALVARKKNGTARTPSLGTRVRLSSGGRTQVREARSGGGYLSSHDPRLHFGLGERMAIDRLEIRWPSGKVQVLENLGVDRLLTIDEDLGVVQELVFGPKANASRSLEGSEIKESRAIRPAALGVLPRSFGPLNAKALQRRAQDASNDLEQGRLAEGVQALRVLIAELPTWPEAASSVDAFGFGALDRYRAFLASLHENLGVGLMWSERFAECEQILGTALELRPKRAQTLLNLGLCRLHGRRFLEAVASFEAAAPLPDRPKDLSYDLGRALAGAGECGRAETALEKALSEFALPEPRGRDAEAWYLIATCRSESGRAEAAIAAFREALVRVPGNQKALYKLAQQLERQELRDVARRAWQLFRNRQPAEEAAQILKRSGANDLPSRLRLTRAYLIAALAPQAAHEARGARALDLENREAALLLARAEQELRSPRPTLLTIDQLLTWLEAERHRTQAFTATEPKRSPLP